METTKQATLVLDDHQISEIEIHGVVQDSVRISKMEWRMQSTPEEVRECR